MKLGTQTGSVINHLHSRAVIGQPEPEVGMGCTVLLWSDRTAATIVSVATFGSALIIGVREDESRVAAGSEIDGSARYEYSQDPNGRHRNFRRKPDGMWLEVHKSLVSGRWIKAAGAGLRIGDRETYRDPSF